MFEARLLRRLDWGLLAIALVLVGFGLVMIYSATRSDAALTGGDPFFFARRQLAWLALGLAALAAALSVEYEALARFSWPAYAAAIGLLVVVLAVGHSPTGARSWIQIGGFTLQPSEFAKPALVLVLAAFLGARQAVGSPRILLASLALAALPLGLVFLQPDLGTALVLAAIWFGLVYLAGASRRQLAVVLGIALVAAAIMWHTDLLKPYQKARLTIFLNPGADPRDAGYHIIQSKTAIGSGQLFGRGLFRGTQSQLRFIPERHTDFIFTVVGEELGLVGAGLVVLLYFALVWKCLHIARHARDRLGRLLAGGVASLLGFQALVNLGMTINLMPITGLPLPFFSYGGSSLVSSLFALGLVLNVSVRTQKLIF